MTFDLERARAADAALPYPLDAKEIWVSGKGQMHINPPNAPSIFFTLSDLCEFRNLFHGQADEIERLQKFRDRIARILKQPLTDCDDLLILGLDSRICQLKRQATRIAELEDALVDCQYAPQPNGCDDWGNPIILSVSGGAYTGTTRSWQITDERKAAIKMGLDFLEYAYAKSGRGDIHEHAGQLRAMLQEAGQE